MKLTSCEANFMLPLKKEIVKMKSEMSFTIIPIETEQ